MPSLIETLRQKSVEHLFSIGSFSNPWKRTWKGQILTHLGNPITATKMLNLGDILSNTFLSTRAAASRSGTASQSGASSAGAAWEALICWYLNFCTIGTRIVAFKLRSMIPTSFRDALTIKYGPTITNSESDLIVLIFPDHSDFTSDINTITNLHRGSNLVKSRFLAHFDTLAALHFNQFSLGVIQCKTNWNENAQIPLLWDLVYKTTSFVPGSHIVLGQNSFQLSNLKRFIYSFVTVPTNELSNYKSTTLPVQRVANLSGGNYWGFPKINGVAPSIKEIFTGKFSDGFTDLRTILTAQIPKLNTVYNYFEL